MKEINQIGDFLNQYIQPLCDLIFNKLLLSEQENDQSDPQINKTEVFSDQSLNKNSIQFQNCCSNLEKRSALRFENLEFLDSKIRFLFEEDITWKQEKLKIENKLMMDNRKFIKKMI